MNATIAYALTIAAAVFIPIALVLTPTATAAGAAAVMMLGLGELWRLANSNDRQEAERRGAKNEVQRWVDRLRGRSGD